MHIVLGIIKVKPQHLDEFLENVCRHAANSLLEPGCVRYDVLQDQNDPTTVCLYEMFRSEADLDFHHAQDYYTAWMAASRDWRDGSSYTRRVLRNVCPED